MSQLSLRDLSFAYDDRRILDRLTLDLPPKSLIGIVGPNGCGKSTLISLIANLRQPTVGAILLDGQDLRSIKRRELARRIAYLPQSPVCPAGITVDQILRFGRQPYQSLLRQFSTEDARQIASVVELLQLAPIVDRPMDQLSGGQRQKAWLGMVLVQDTDVILLDEPTSALDIGHQYEVLECIRMVRDLGKTVVMVIHDLAAAARFCDHVVAMKDGVICQFGASHAVINESLILSLYGLHVEVLTANAAGTPVIVPVRLQPPNVP